MTQAAFAAQLGVTKQHLSDIERDRRGVSIERAAAWAKTLGYHAGQFVEMALQAQVRTARLPFAVWVSAASPSATAPRHRHGETGALLRRAWAQFEAARRLLDETDALLGPAVLTTAPAHRRPAQLTREEWLRGVLARAREVFARAERVEPVDTSPTGSRAAHAARRSTPRVDPSPRNRPVH